jgi:hypothetical protein
MQHRCVGIRKMVPTSRNIGNREMLTLIRAVSPLFVHLDYSAGVIQHADNCPA